MPKASKSKDRRPRARHRRTLKRAVVAADARPRNRRIWPSLVAPILDHLLIERVFQLTCVAKLFNDAIPFLSVVEQRGVADNSPDRDKARHVLWQPAVWLRLGRARQVTLAIETPEALLHLAGLATASKRSWEVIDLFCSFQSDVEADGLVAQALSGLADALRHGALPALESLTIHCRGDSNDWTTKLGRRAPPPVDAALAKLCVALPPYLAVTCAVEWTLAPHVCAQVLNDRPEVDVNRSKAYLPSALTTWADAADDSDAAMAILRLLLARGADVRRRGPVVAPLKRRPQRGEPRRRGALGGGRGPGRGPRRRAAASHGLRRVARRRRALPVLLARALAGGRRGSGAAPAARRSSAGVIRCGRGPVDGARVCADADAPKGHRRAPAHAGAGRRRIPGQRPGRLPEASHAAAPPPLRERAPRHDGPRHRGRRAPRAPAGEHAAGSATQGRRR